MTGPHPEVAAQRLAVRAAVADVAPGGVVLVACSGGADSLALAASTAFVAERSGIRAGAVVVDHGLQPGSREVADRAAEQCRGLGLGPVDVVRVDVPSGAGPEASARTARYTALEAAAQRHGAAAVLLGHTLDDQAETVLLGLARGSGARSLAGMPARRGLLRRPFLGVRRTGTATACAASGLEPWHDPTNGPWPAPTDGPSPGGVADAEHRTAGGPPAALAPLRSRVRHEVMPVLDAVLGPGAAVALARTADELREDADVLDELAARLLADARLDGAGVGARPDGGPEGGADAGLDLAGLDVAVLAAAPAGIRRRALHAALLAAGLPGGALGRGHVLAVDALVVDWHGQGPLDLPGGTARRRCGRLTLTGR